MTDTQYLTKSLRFLAGYLSFDDDVVASVLFLFGLVLCLKGHSSDFYRGRKVVERSSTKQQ